MDLREAPPRPGATRTSWPVHEADPVTLAISMPPREGAGSPSWPSGTRAMDEGGDGAFDVPPDVSEFLGRYQNLGEIARGGMGRVHRVRDLSLNRELAFKVMLVRAPDPDRRFMEEAQITGQLQHPGIPRSTRWAGSTTAPPTTR